jgi:hypothetical protein
MYRLLTYGIIYSLNFAYRLPSLTRIQTLWEQRFLHDSFNARHIEGAQ